MLIRDVLKINKELIDPQKHKDDLFHHFSLPAFDNNKTPEIQYGANILSSKFKLTRPCILFNKLNVRFKRIWNILATNNNDICSSEFLPLYVYNDLFLQNYMYYLLLSDEVNNKLILDVNGTSSSHQRIDPNTLLNMEIQPKDIAEQQHIVNILGTIDDKIENNEKKITKIKELMAHLYENISLNKDCVKIGDLTCEIKERLDDRTAKAYSVINSGELVEQDSYFDRQIHSKDMYKYKVIRKYDFAYNPSRINIGSVAMFEHDFGAVSPIYIAFSCNKKYSYYINEFIKTQQFNKEICLRANGSVRQSVNYDVFVEIQIPLPDENELTKYNNEYAILQENIASLKNENTKLNDLKNLYLKKFFG